MLTFPSSDGAARAPVRTAILAARRFVCGVPIGCPRAHSLALALLLPTVACVETAPPLRVERAAIATPAGGAPTALYFTAQNTSGRPVRIVAVDVEGVGRAGMRTTTAHRMPSADPSGGSMTILSPVTSVPVAARATVRFAPGGYSVVLDSIVGPLRPGDSVSITLRLETGESARGVARVVRYADLDTLLAPARGVTDGPATPSVEEGRALFASDGCAGCHGPLGHGDGPVARTLDPPPRDFRVAAAFRNGIDESAIAQTIATGIPDGGSMPLYAHLTDRERRSLARYVISLRTPLTEDLDR